MSNKIITNVYFIVYGQLEQSRQKEQDDREEIRKELLEALEEEGLSPETEAKINELLAETKQWIDYCEWLDNLIAFLESEEIFKHVPKPS